ARTPVFLEEGDPAAVARWHWRNEHLDHWYVDVISVGVLDSSAPPPPGLSRWPEPGQVFASDTLLAREGAQDFLSRYGDVVGTVDVAGLADPGERLAYVGADPALMDPERSFLIGGFGREAGSRPGDMGYLGSALYQQSRTGFWFGLSLFGVAPALIMTVVVARLGGERRGPGGHSAPRTTLWSARSCGRSGGAGRCRPAPEAGWRARRWAGRAGCGEPRCAAAGRWRRRAARHAGRGVRCAW